LARAAEVGAENSRPSEACDVRCNAHHDRGAHEQQGQEMIGYIQQLIGAVCLVVAGYMFGYRHATKRCSHERRASK